MPAKLNITDQERKARKQEQKRQQSIRYRDKHPLTEGQKARRAAMAKARNSTPEAKQARNKRQLAWRAKNPHKVKEYNDKTYAENPEYKRESSRKSYWRNHDRVIARNKIKYADNPEYYIARASKWAKENPEKRNAAKRANYRHKYDTDPSFRIACSLKARLTKTVKRCGAKKFDSTFKVLGCSLPDFMLYLESKFKPWMTWDNYGEWHVDHIVPIAIYDLKDVGQQKLAFHFSNLQPLRAIDNLRKNKFLPTPALGTEPQLDVSSGIEQPCAPP